MPNTTVIHHNDNDGWVSAFVAKQALEAKNVFATFIETNYGHEAPDVTGQDVYIVDFSYPRDLLEKMRESANSLVVIDHHKTAQAELADLTYTIFDMNHSGCKLTQLYFDQPDHWIIDYVEDRDLWKWQLENSPEINAALNSYPKGFESWEALWKRQPGELVTEGTAILRYQERIVETACALAETVEFCGYQVPVVNAPFLQSEIAGKLAEGQPFGAVFAVKNDGTRIYSLRSKVGGVDVSEIAKTNGGGGHKNAAGFSVKPLAG